MTKVSTNLTWTNSDRGPSGRWPRDGNIKRIEDREDMNVWDQEVLHKLWLTQTSLLRSTISYILFPGEKWDEVRKRTISQAVLHKGNTGYFNSITGQEHSCLETDKHSSSQWQELGSQDPKHPKRPSCRRLLALPSIFLVLRRSYVPSPNIRALGKASVELALNTKFIGILETSYLRNRIFVLPLYLS